MIVSDEGVEHPKLNTQRCASMEESCITKCTAVTLQSYVKGIPKIDLRIRSCIESPFRIHVIRKPSGPGTDTDAQERFIDNAKCEM